jgi:tetratricopeptide (TPR) repeat protein
VQSKKLGRFQRDTLAAKAFWAVVLVALNRRSAGETLLREVVAEQRPQDDIRALDRIGDVAYTLCMQGRFKESEELECYILQRQTPILGPEHPNTLRTIVRLGRTLSLQRKFKEARDMLMEVLERQGRVLGERHREVWITCEEIARCLRDMGNGDDAKQYFRRAWGE